MLLAVTAPDRSLETIATTTMWIATVGAVLLLLVLDFAITRKPHKVKMREALG